MSRIIIRIENLSVIINTSFCLDNGSMTVLATSATFVVGITKDEKKASSTANTHCVPFSYALLAARVTAQAFHWSLVRILTLIAFKRPRFQIGKCYGSDPDENDDENDHEGDDLSSIH